MLATSSRIERVFMDVFCTVRAARSILKFVVSLFAWRRRACQLIAAYQRSILHLHTNFKLTYLSRESRHYFSLCRHEISKSGLVACPPCLARRSLHSSPFSPSTNHLLASLQLDSEFPCREMCRLLLLLLGHTARILLAQSATDRAGLFRSQVEGQVLLLSVE